MIDYDTPRRRLLEFSAVGLTATSGCVTNITGSPDTYVAPDDRPTSFIQRDGTQLALDGEPVYLFGTRPKYVINFNETKPSLPATLFGDRVGEMFDRVVKMGGTLARVHAFQPFWGDESLQPQPGQTNEKVMQRLDRIIEAARNRGLRLSLILINGMPAYHNAEDITDNYGVNVHTYANHADAAESHDDFYTTEECKHLYKQRVETVLTRENTITGVEYRNDPTIAFWELGNEIEFAQGWKYDDPSLRPWISEMSPYVKSIDDNHLVTTGEHGWPAGRNNFIEDHRPDDVDLCSIHYYPGPQAYDLPNDPERDHPELLAGLIETGHEELEKPVYVGEYNWKVEEGADPQFPKRNAELETIHNTIDRLDVSAAAFHALGVDTQENYPRVGATVYADTDEGTMTEFRRIAGVFAEKSATGTLPAVQRAE